MNYYERHIGDYLKDTAHLSLLEHGIYTRLMDVYYTREAPIPEDQAARLIGARSKEEREALEAVLAEFFERTPDGWMQERCEREIERYQDKQAKAKRSANARWSAQPSQSDGNANASADAMRTHSEGNAPRARPQTPDTRHQTQLIPEPIGSVGKPDALPVCQTQSVIDLYHEVLPELPKVRLLTDKRRRDIGQRWRWVLTSKKADNTRRAETAEQALGWFREYFGRARENDFLMGRGTRSGEHANWQCDIDFLLSERGMKHVIEKTRGAA